MLYFPAFAVTNQFRGVNWADTRDNFVSDVLVLSGLSTKDTYESASIVANRVIGQFVELLGTNSVRLPINEPTVS
ncbi:MAG: carbohydrate-binding protein, partial [Fibrobacter sp.]|nr:carbohydrate-binding protein [Fibrobacter sp.]